MSELANRTYWALVDYSSAAADAAWAAMLAEAPIVTEGPGLTQNDAVQIVANVAATRDLVGNFQCRTIVEYTHAGVAVAVWEVYGVYAAHTLTGQIIQRGNVYIFVVGDAPLQKYGPGGFSQPGDQTASDPTMAQILADISPVWGMKLALALDEVVARIGKAQIGGAPPGSIDQVIAPALGTTAVIVAGVAIAVIGSLAAWRYLDPDLRASALMIKAAAESYAERLQTYAQTGTMPPASEVEKDAAPTVQSFAKSRSATDWSWGIGVVVGVSLAFLAVAALGSSSKRDVSKEVRAA
jgi:hypothetical protein